MKPPYAIGSVPSLSGHAIAYRWRSLPRVRRHRASKAQGSSERVLPCLADHHGPINIRLSFPHPLLVYEVGMLKVPADIRFESLILYRTYRQLSYAQALKKTGCQSVEATLCSREP